MIPFLVLDRVTSLRVVKGADLQGTIGFMSHANVSPLFKRLFKNYPCGESPCHAIDPMGKTVCTHLHDGKQCELASNKLRHIIKMCDCGMFTKEGSKYSYADLFDIYEQMGADYGIMQDVFRDRDKTLESAKIAINIYHKHDYNFKLVLVAQGNSLDEYLKSYDSLSKLGNEYIAIGGLVNRRVNTVRYVNVRDEKLMLDVLSAIRESYNPEWLFALGSYHPKRHEIFKHLNVWGSDYKGWIFKYKKRERLIQNLWEEISTSLIFMNPNEKDPTLIRFNALVEKRASILLIYEKSNINKSPRNLLPSDRIADLIKIDNSLYNALFMIHEKLSLNGTIFILEQKKNEIENLGLMTDQQIRFNQLRELINGLARL